ncbi:MAG: 16S rRNA (cytosine(1402)-N(4))-methyltransferase RsmH [Saccharofermentanales bacterium]|jgi:16S rRNA (cytosine1402-N4)-methyltransferase|nr:16S rRNA (cytosine(1402)-N(4))-methyltransferase RsmH [Clostridiaceae bacterium]
MTSRDFNAWHTPVLLEETIDSLDVQEDGLYLDLTCGGGGHSAEILKKLGDNGRLYAADRDAASVRICEERLFALQATGQFRTVVAPFSALTDWLPDEDRGKVNGLLADLGVSSHQLDNPERGFSYLHDGPLDMRMDRSQEETAEKLIGTLTQDELTCVFRTYGEEQYAARIARAIVHARHEAQIRTTGRLAEIVAQAVPPKARRGGHPARRVFQAIRMAVNHEYDELSKLLEIIPDIMASGGRVVIISFHSLEDRMVKQAMRRWEHPCECPSDLPCVCGKKPLGRAVRRQSIVAGEREKENNPRSRSARLRAFKFGEEAT